MPTIRTDDLTWREVDEEIVILDLQGSNYFNLNGTGAELWKLLAEGVDEAGLVSHLVAAYQISEAQAAADVRVFLDDCAALGLFA